jgi:hypothetical protein
VSVAADEDTITGLDFDYEEPCTANESTCKHDAVAIVLFRPCERHPLTKGWHTACQKHLDDAIAHKVVCTGCKQHLVLMDHKPL